VTPAAVSAAAGGRLSGGGRGPGRGAAPLDQRAARAVMSRRQANHRLQEMTERELAAG